MAEAAANPYVGPRTFTYTERERFFGREREARDLLSLVIAERLVLFYAQSGAGKSSLLNTRLAPQLKEAGYAVLPMARVGGELPEGVNDVDNIFVFNCLLHLDQRSGDPQRFMHMTLKDFLSRLTSPDGESYYYDDSADPAEDVDTYEEPLHILLIDQFEEIVTTHLERWQERVAFFRQLEEAMAADPLLWVVLTLREDYVAALDPYAGLLSNRLRARFYMQRMGYEAALEAVRQPAQQYGRPFAPDVAETLVDNLRQIRLRDTTATGLGQFIEPVQLQVVCYQLWENLQDRDAGEITAQDLLEAGDVDTALASFYEAALAIVLHDRRVRGVTELAVRNWFDQKLITEARTRGMVYRGETHTAELPNLVVQLLEGRYVLRSEIRSGGIWYELIHDRFVEPIAQANRAWWDKQNPLLREAQAWQEANHDKGKLYLGAKLQEALVSVAQGEPEPVVAAFLAASEGEQHALDVMDAARQKELEATQALVKEREQTAAALRKRARVLLGLMIVAFLGTVVASLSLYQAKEAKRSADAQRLLAEEGEKSNRRLLYVANMNLVHRAYEEENYIRVKELLDAHLPKTTATAQEELRDFAWYHFWRLWHIWLHGHGEGEIAILPDASPERALALSPDGKMLAVGGKYAVVDLWDTDMRKPLEPLQMGPKFVGPVAFSPDGKTLAVAAMAPATKDGIVVLWDTKNHTPQEPLKADSQHVNSLAFSPDGKTLAAGSEYAPVKLWDTKTRKPLEPLEGDSSSVRFLGFSPDGRMLVTSYGVANLWDTGMRRRICQLDGEFSGGPMSFSPDSKILAAVKLDRTVGLWDTSTCKPLEPLKGSSDSSRSVAFSPDGETLVTVGNETRLWSVRTREQWTMFAGAVGEWGAFFPDGKTLVTATNRDVRLWDISWLQESLPLTKHSWGHSAVALSSDGQTLAISREDNIVELWNIRTRQLVAMIKGHTKDVSSVAFSSNGERLATGSKDGTVRVWDLQDTSRLEKPVYILDGLSSVEFVTFVPRSNILAIGAQYQELKLWDIEAKTQVPEVIKDCGFVGFVAFSPDGKTFIAGCYEETKLLDIQTHTEVMKGLLSSSHGPVAFSPDGRIVAMMEWDVITSSDNVKLWDMDMRRELAVLKGHSKNVASVAFSPDGKTLATGGDDSTVKLWDLRTRQELSTFKRDWAGNLSRVTFVAFSPDGKMLVIGTMDGMVRLWYAATDKEVTSLEEQIHSKK